MNATIETAGAALFGLPARHFESSTLPLVLEAPDEHFDVLTWARENREGLRAQLTIHGGILLRGFKVSLEDLACAVSGDLLAYNERSSPRTRVAGNIYTSTEYPPDQEIFLHNENSYQRQFPGKIYFACLHEPESLGATPLADCRKVYAKIPVAIREKFERNGVLYTRNFSNTFGLPWSVAFNTDDPKTVENYCLKNSIHWQWKANGELKTWQRNAAVRTHPASGARSWCNHATFFHITTLAPEIRDFLMETLPEDDFPNNTYYGDGEPIEPETLDELRRIYRSETVRFSWRNGDVLALDNILVAHGREPFTGRRRVTVAMSELQETGT